MDAELSYVARVEHWLADNPGWHTPLQVGAGLGSDTTTAAHALHYLTRRGRIKRRRDEQRRNGPGSSYYAA